MASSGIVCTGEQASWSNSKMAKDKSFNAVVSWSHVKAPRWLYSYSKKCRSTFLDGIIIILTKSSCCSGKAQIRYDENAISSSLSFSVLLFGLGIHGMDEVCSLSSGLHVARSEPHICITELVKEKLQRIPHCGFHILRIKCHLPPTTRYSAKQYFPHYYYTAKHYFTCSRTVPEEGCRSLPEIVGGAVSLFGS